MLGLTLIAVGLSLGAIFISLGQIILGANWLLEADFKTKYRKIVSQPILWFFLFFFVLHLAGLLWSDNLNYGIEDIKIKLPLLALPLIFSTTTPLATKEWKFILLIYLLSVLAATGWSMVFYLGWKKSAENDIRNLSRFFSHIRFAMNIVFSIFVGAWLSSHEKRIYRKISFLLISVWLFLFLFILGSLTGIVLICILLIMTMIYLLNKRKGILLKSLVFTSLVILIFILLGYGISFYNDFFTPRQNINEKLELWTSKNDLYYHEENLARENGYFVWRYNAYEELQECWNQRSTLKFDGKDRKGNPLRFTLIRYMTSMGIRKDADQFQKLSDEDIRQIENGIPNYKLVNASPMKRRMYEAMWELNDYLENGSINNHSLALRLVYWKTAWHILKKEIFLGVGTGDVQDAFTQQYEKDNSPLKNEEDRRRAHNQFLEIGVGLGLLGIISLIALLTAPILYKEKKHILFYPFYFILLLSMLTEDTLETQAGVSLFVFFLALFIFQIKNENGISDEFTEKKKSSILPAE